MPSQPREQLGASGSRLVPALGVQHPVLLHPWDCEAKNCLSVPTDATEKSGVFRCIGDCFSVK